LNGIKKKFSAQVAPTSSQAAELSSNVGDVHRQQDLLSHCYNFSREQIRILAAETTGQHRNERWFDERRKRIPASNFGQICRAARASLSDMAKNSYIQPV